MAARKPYRSARKEGELALLSEEVLRDLRRRLRHAHRLTYEEWHDIAMVFFVEAGARDVFEDLLYAAEAGKIAPRGWSADAPEVRSLNFDSWDNCKEPCTVAGEPASHVPGLILKLTKEVRRQVALNIDELRLAGRDLDVHGNRKAIQDREGTPFRRMSDGAFIDGLRPGQTVVVTGVPGSGKTHFALEHIAAPSIAAGWVVVSNIEVHDAPAGYVHVITFSEGLIACIDAALEGKKVIFLRDEGAQGRARADSQTWEAKSMRSASYMSRHLGISECLVYQSEIDVPREIEELASHYYSKISQQNQGLVFCETKTGRGGAVERWEVSDLPSIEVLKKAGRPFLEYEHEKFAPLRVDADFTPLVEVTFLQVKRSASGSLTHREVLQTMKRELIRFHEAPQDINPLDLDQIYRLVAIMHDDDTRIKPYYYAKVLEKDWAANGVKTRKEAQEILRGWGLSAHPDQASRRCHFCRNVGKRFPELDTKKEPPEDGHEKAVAMGKPEVPVETD